MFMKQFFFFFNHLQGLPYNLIVGIQQLFSTLIHYSKYFSLHVVEILFAETLRSLKYYLQWNILVFTLGDFFFFFSFFCLHYSRPSLSLYSCACCHFIQVQLYAALCTVACQVPQSMGFSRQEYIGVGCHALLQGIFPIQRSNPCLLCLLHWQ